MGLGILSNCKLLLERLFGGKFLTALSTEKGQNFSPTLDLCLPRFSNNSYVIVGSCNGVLCLDDHNGRVVLWNPSNGARKELPQSSLQIDPFADDHGFYCSGFGFDCKYTDYKVVRFLQTSFEVDGRYDHTKQQIEIYSYNRDSWKEIFGPCELYIHSDISVYLNGVYYWKALSKAKVFVLSFNFVDEKFSRISLPKSLRRPFECYLDLLEFNGLLAVCAYPIGGTEKSFKVWVFNEKLWTEECSIDPISGVERPLGFWKNGQEMFFEGSHHELLLYDRASRKLKPLHIHNNTGIHDEPATMRLIPYVESSELEERVIEIHQSEAHQASASPSARAPASTAARVTEPGSVVSSIAASESDVNSQAASNLDGESNLEGAIQRILDMGGRTWERDTVVSALRATDNNPERAVEYLYSMLESTHSSSLLKRKKNILLEQPPSKAPRVDHEEVWHFLGLDGRSRKLKWYVLDVNRGKRITRVKMPNDVPCGSTAVAYLNHLYLIGGDDETCISDGIDDPFPALKRVLCFDLDNPKKGWTYAPSMFFGRFSPTVIAFNGKIYVFGGSRTHFAEVFDIIQGTWAELKPPNYDSFHASSPVLLDSSRSRILVHCFLNHSLYAYNVADESWECLNKNYGEWSRHSVVVDGVIYSLVFDDYFTLSLRAYGVDEEKELGIKCLLSGDEVRVTNWGCHLYHLGNHKLCLAGYDGVERCIRYKKFIVPQCKNSRQIGDSRDPASELLQSIKLKASIWKFV